MISPFVGRTRELHSIRAALEASASAGRLIAVAGEPGMGKTRLMTEVAQMAEARGHAVLWSQVIEDPFAPPYVCWLLLLRAALQKYPDDVLAEGAGAGAADLAVLLPELRERLGLPGARSAPASAASRFQLFDAVTRFLLAMAQRQPLVLLFDNLHLADRSSMEMLEYYGQHVCASPVLVICAYRDRELKQVPAARLALARLSRMAGYERLELGGLAREEVAALLKLKLGRPAPASVVGAVFEQSDGNPLFVAEVGDELARADSPRIVAIGTRFRVPETLTAVIAARLDSLPVETAQVLAVAAVLGRDFDADALSELSESATDVATLLEPAESAGIIVPLAPGRFRFSHALYREVPYAALGHARRVELHRRAAAYLERRHAADLSPRLNELAWHCFRSLGRGGQDKAVDYCTRAGDAAWSRRAFLEAATFYEQAWQAALMRPERDQDEEFALLLALGRSQHRGGQLVIASESFLKAALLAERRRRWVDLAEAMLEFQGVRRYTNVMHVSAEPLIRLAIEHVAPSSPVLHARLTSALAVGRCMAAGAAPDVPALFRESVELARRCNDDLVLIECLQVAPWFRAASPRERAAWSREAVELARRRDRPDLLTEPLACLTLPLCELGEIAEVEELLPGLRELVRSQRDPHHRNVVIGIETAIAILRGRWAEAIRCANEGVRQVPLQGVLGLEGRYGLQMFAIQRARGALAAVAPLAERLIGGADPASLWLPGQVLLHCELGQLPRARAVLQRLGRLDDLPKDDMYLLNLVYLAEACACLKDTARCRELLERLLPYRDRNLSVFTTLMLGSVAGYVAPLAVLLRRPHDARKLFDEAIEMNTRMGALPALARTCVDYAGFLLAAEHEQDRVRARQLLGQAAPIAEALELKPVQAVIERLQQGPVGGSLTPRELAVLRLMADGASNKKISRVLDIRHSTVATHVRNILRKTGASNRTEAAELARRSDLLQPEPPLR